MNIFPEFEAMFRAVKVSVILLGREESTFFSVWLCIMYVCIYYARTVRGYLVQYENIVCQHIILLVARIVTFIKKNKLYLQNIANSRTYSTMFSATQLIHHYLLLLGGQQFRM